MKPKFDASTTTDAKRLVRGEHWLTTRTTLRRRDSVHHRAWRVVTLAGGNPAEEIKCIRSLMPKAIIVAVDIDDACLAEAKHAGADEVFNVDVCAPLKLGTGAPLNVDLPEELRWLEAADVLNLDMCGPVTSFAGVVKKYSSLMRRGVLMATFSYGRDVRECFEPGAYRGIPEPVAGRVRYLDENSSLRMNLTSVLAYPGKEMPMCSALWLPFRRGDDPYDTFRTGSGTWAERIAVRPMPAFERIADVDLDVAVEHLDAAALYGLPADRIRAMRRSAAARKAVATRTRGVALLPSS